MRSWSEEKPTHANQLFYKSFIKLPVNTELTLHGYYVDRWLHIKSEICHVQFLGMELVRGDTPSTSNDHFWNARVRLEDGKEDLIYLSGFGAVPTHANHKGYEWISDSWITLRYP